MGHPACTAKSETRNCGRAAIRHRSSRGPCLKIRRVVMDLVHLLFEQTSRLCSSLHPHKGFVHHDLRCFASSATDSIPRVVCSDVWLCMAEGCGARLHGGGSFSVHRRWGPIRAFGRTASRPTPKDTEAKDRMGLLGSISLLNAGAASS